MSQACGKSPSDNDVQDIKHSIQDTKLQGDIGEQVAAQVAINELNFTGVPFDPPHNGFDSVYRDPSGKLVIVEAKFTEKSGVGALGNTAHGRQGSVEWIRYNAELMTNPLSSRYSPDNAKIGREILEKGPENIRCLLIHTSPDSLNHTVHVLR